MMYNHRVQYKLKRSRRSGQQHQQNKGRGEARQDQKKRLPHLKMSSGDLDTFLILVCMDVYAPATVWCGTETGEGVRNIY